MRQSQRSATHELVNDRPPVAPWQKGAVILPAKRGRGTATQVGLARLGQALIPNSAKAEFGAGGGGEPKRGACKHHPLPTEAADG